MTTIVIFGFLTACNIFGVTWLSSSREITQEGQVIVESVPIKDVVQ